MHIQQYNYVLDKKKEIEIGTKGIIFLSLNSVDKL
jgi:hypothetical protein